MFQLFRLRIVSRSALIALLACGLVSMGPGVQAARAALVTTESAIEGTSSSQQTRARLQAFLEREAVTAELARLGIDPAQARRSVDGMTDRELAAVEGRLSELPAGAGGAEAFIAGVVVVFLALLITDILGYTDIFPWVTSQP
jgi:hypothetical protein